jgi:hypothetical protein
MRNRRGKEGVRMSSDISNLVITLLPAIFGLLGGL